ncbi:TetR/AcrR family transcriptional regulator [Rheinheimera sp. NSM]|uniref:TetR/AcrR family transcriptional regulator n=1 Tax=Rheinheimera sp. NSM TaxID=3457884 RepID=UPI004037043E
MPQQNRSRQNEKVRIAILDAAFSLVREVGYDKLTIEGIAKRAGAGKQTLYRWWSSKALILLEALVEHVKDELVFADTGNIRDDLLAQMLRVEKLLTSKDTGCLFIGLLVEAQFNQDVANAMNVQIYQPTYRAATERLAIAQRHGELQPGLDPVMMVELLYAPIYYRLIVPCTKLTAADIPKFLDMILAGIRL